MKTCRMHIIADSDGNVLAAATLDDDVSAADADMPIASVTPCDGQCDMIVDLPEAALTLSGPDFQDLMEQATISPKDGFRLPKSAMDKLVD